MLVTFAIDSSALALGKTPRSACLVIHKRLIEKWLDCGLLIFAGSRLKESTLVKRIEDLPQEIRKLWLTALKTGRTLPGPDGWVGLEAVQHVDDFRAIAGKVRLACLERDRYHLALNLDEGTAEVNQRMNDPDIEVTCFECADQAETFRSAAELGSKSIEADTNVLDLWKARFQTLAECTSNVVVVDAHGLKDGNSINGLEGLLKQLDASAKRCKVELYCSYGYDDSGKLETLEYLTDKLRAIRKKLNRGGVPASEIHLYAAHFSHFKNQAHDRYVRFDGHVFEIGVGVEIFYPGTTGRVPRRTTSVFKRRDQFHQKTEQHLRSNADNTCPWQV